MVSNLVHFMNRNTMMFLEKLQAKGPFYPLMLRNGHMEIIYLLSGALYII
jgi:hypothetical protein